jgi:hypothetical protein
MAERTASKVSPRGGKRGCLCKDGKYRKECCDGSLEAQGIGKTTGTGTDVVNITENNGVRTIVRQNG